MLGELRILLVIDVPVGDLAEITPHRLSTVAAAVKEPYRHRTKAGFGVTPQYPATQGRPFGNVQSSPYRTRTDQRGQPGGFGE